MGVLLTVIAAFYGYFTFSDYLTKWYGSIKMDSILIDKLFTDYYSLFIFANYIGIILPCIIIAFPQVQVYSKHNCGRSDCCYRSLGKPLYNCYPHT